MWGQINELVVQSSHRIITGIANFLPGLLALLVIVSITIILTALVRVVLRRFLESIDFDGLIQRWGFPELAEWSPQHSPSVLASRIVSWSIILVGMLIGINALDAALTSVLVVRLLAYIPHVIAAVVVL